MVAGHCLMSIVDIGSSPQVAEDDSGIILATSSYVAGSNLFNINGDHSVSAISSVASGMIFFVYTIIYIY